MLGLRGERGDGFAGEYGYVLVCDAHSEGFRGSNKLLLFTRLGNAVASILFWIDLQLCTKVS